MVISSHFIKKSLSLFTLIVLSICNPLHSQTEYASVDWIKVFGGSNEPPTGMVQFRDLAIDLDNNIYHVGRFRANSNFIDFTTNDQVISKGLFDGYITKYDSDGK